SASSIYCCLTWPYSLLTLVFFYMLLQQYPSTRIQEGSVQLTCRKHDSLQKGTKLFLCYDIAKVIMEAVQLNKETGSEGLKSNKVTKRHLA
uniref:Major facilitator superfamily (MFS) profile domain-containing protein n=1 Tax=Parascaris univalens TaxID=6257 RepID=A0A915AGF6_PARUN